MCVCSFKSCLDIVEELNSRNEKLREEVESLKLDYLGYKVGIENVERRLDYLKKCELEYVDRINIQDGEIFLKNSEIHFLKQKLEEAIKERDTAIADKEKHVVRVEKVQFTSDLVHKSIESHLMMKGSGIGYNETPPLVKSAFAPSGKELSFMENLDTNKSDKESSESSYKTTKTNTSKSSGAPIFEDWVSDSEDDSDDSTKNNKSVETSKVEPQIKQTRFVKPRLGHAISRKIVEYIENPREQLRQVDNRLRGNQRNFNNLISHNLGVIFNWLKRHVIYVVVLIIFKETVIYQKPVWNQSKRVNNQKFSRNTHPHPNSTMIPRAVLMRFGHTRIISTTPFRRYFQSHAVPTANV